MEQYAVDGPCHGRYWLGQAVEHYRDGGRREGETATITGLIRPDGWLFADIKGLNFDCPGVFVYAVEPP